MRSELNRLFHQETVQDSGVADGKVVRQRGGIGSYAHMQVEVRPLSRGQGRILAWNAGLNIPAEFVPAVLQGIQDTLHAGVLAKVASAFQVAGTDFDQYLSHQIPKGCRVRESARCKSQVPRSLLGMWQGQDADRS
jgi:hypothetical protein